MKKFCLVCLLMIIGQISFASSKPVGDGTKENPYRISNRSELFWFSELTNGTLSDEKQNTSACAILINDIVVNKGIFDEDGNNSKVQSPVQWTPIVDCYNKYFSGIFDGNNHTISGLYCVYDGLDSSHPVGFVGNMEQGGVIKNLIINNSYFKGYSTVGTFCAFSYNGKNKILNCTSNSVVKGNLYVGGICGQCVSGTTIDGCCFTGKISNTGKCTGGITGVAEANSVVANCQNYGIIKADSWYIGGIVGRSLGSQIICCSNHSAIEISSPYSGGIVGESQSSVVDCYNEGNITSRSYEVGGITGNNYSIIQNCYNVGKITGTFSKVGAICGANFKDIKNCYYLKKCAYNDVDRKYYTGIGQYATVFGTSEIESSVIEGGMFCYMLNGNGSETKSWRQNIDKGSKDSHPVLDANHNMVYYGYRDCLATNRTYNNFGGHEIKPVHVYSDQPCPYCGGFEPRTIIANGSCGGKNVGFNVYSDGLLEIEGNYSMNRYDDEWPPYHEYYDMITKLVVKEGITWIGYEAFYAMPNLTEAIIEANSVSIGEDAFSECARLERLQFTGSTEIDEDGICYGSPNLQEIYITGDFGTFDLEDIGVVPATTLIKYDNPNSTIMVRKQYANTHNLIVKGVCENLVLTDGYPYCSDYNFTATSITYNRCCSDDWETIVLPFTAYSNDNVQFYSIENIQDGVITVSEIDVLYCGTPAIVRFNNINEVSICITGTGSVSSSIVNSSNPAFSLKGSYVNTSVPNGSYILKNGCFQGANEGSSVEPFRAFLAYSDNDTESLAIENDEQVTTSIMSPLSYSPYVYYQINGISTPNPISGVNIIKCSDGRVVKIIK